MYSIKSDNGYMYGPAEMPQIERWIAEGRIVPNTVLVDHLTNEEGPAVRFPLVAEHFQSAEPPIVRAAAASLSQAPPIPQSQPQIMAPQVSGTNPIVINNYVNQATTNQAQAFAPPQPVYLAAPPKQKIVAALLAFFLGPLGLYQFYLGKTGLGITMLLLTLLTGGIGGIVTVPWAFIEFVIILCGGGRDVYGQPLI